MGQGSVVNVSSPDIIVDIIVGNIIIVGDIIIVDNIIIVGDININDNIIIVGT